jgi:hypothetical protein
MLAGREDDIPQVLGAREDVLDRLEMGTEVDGHLAIEERRLTGFRLFLFIVHFLWHRLFYTPRETRVLFLPRLAVDRLRQSSQDDAADDTFISDGDLFSAWIARTVASAEPKPHPMTIIHFMNARGRMPWLAKTGGVYIQNMVGLAFTFLTPQLARATTRQIAVENRRQLNEQGTEAQVSAFFRRIRSDVRSGKRPRAEFGETNARPVFINNLTKGAFMQVTDFSPAVVRQDRTGIPRANPPGTMVNYLHLIPAGHFKACDNFYVLGKDHGDNYWFMGTVSDQAWTEIDKGLLALRANRDF